MFSLRRWPIAVAALVLVSGIGMLARAADEKSDRKSLDKTLINTMRDVMNVGVDLYNSDNHEGCYHTFRALLLTVKPVIDHRPDLQKHIDNGLKAAEMQPIMWQRARALRTTLDDVRKSLADGKPVDLPPDGKKPEPPKPVTLWDKLGGKDKVEKILADYLAASNKDPIATRNGKLKVSDDKLADAKKGMVEFISSVTGGPLKYTGKSIKEVHKGLDITKEEFDANAKHFKATLESNGVKPADVTDAMKIVSGFEKDIVVEKKPEPPKVMTLWEKLGGKDGVTKVVDDFVATASKDKKVNFDRDGKIKLTAKDVDDFKKAMVDWVSSQTGGPLKYTGKSMKDAHKGMAITDAEFDATVKHLKDALEKSKVKKEDVDLVLKAAEATRKDIVEPKKPDDKKPDDKKPDDKKPDDKKPTDKP